MYLKDGTLLQGGKYRIIRLLGQGGFGITYEAEHTMFRQKVAVKEFFMKDICNRDEETCGVSVPSLGSRELVEKFRVKFIKEAQLLWSLNHPHIVRVLDVFEENATAYYVMELVPGGSLKGMIVKNGPLSEAVAEGYVRQVADALAYIHSRHTVHLDVKPSNILLRTPGDVVLIDFGISKHCDQAGGQTSSTPVGLSKGFAPMEQGRDGDVRQFKPSTDIYALGATLYYLLSGTVPPEASIIAEDGLPRPDGISDRMWAVIEKSMKPFRKDRPQDINAFLSLLDSPVWEPEPRLDKEPYEEETEWNETVLEVKPEPSPIEEKSFPVFTEVFLWLSSIIGAAVVLFLISAVCAAPQSFFFINTASGSYYRGGCYHAYRSSKNRFLVSASRRSCMFVCISCRFFPLLVV